MDDVEIKQQGQHLREEVNALYRDLKIRRAVKMDNDVTTLLLKYIPIGTTFDIAEAVLRAAGCEVSPRPSGHHEGMLSYTDRVNARATLSRGLWDFGVSFFVSLRPSAPGDYTTIGSVRGSILKAVP